MTLQGELSFKEGIARETLVNALLFFSEAVIERQTIDNGKNEFRFRRQEILTMSFRHCGGQTAP